MNSEEKLNALFEISEDFASILINNFWLNESDNKHIKFELGKVLVYSDYPTNTKPMQYGFDIVFDVFTSKFYMRYMTYNLEMIRFTSDGKAMILETKNHDGQPVKFRST